MKNAILTIVLSQVWHYSYNKVVALEKKGTNDI